MFSSTRVKKKNPDKNIKVLETKELFKYYFPQCKHDITSLKLSTKNKAASISICLMLLTVGIGLRKFES